MTSNENTHDPATINVPPRWPRGRYAVALLEAVLGVALLMTAADSLAPSAAAAERTSAGPLDLLTKALELEGSTFTAGDAAAGDEYGLSVSVSRDWAVVGAPGDDPGGLAEAGSAYVYRRVDGTWTFFDKLNADTPAAGDNFGFSVSVGTQSDPASLHEAYIVVGAPRTDESTGLGRAFFFRCWTDTGSCPMDTSVAEFVDLVGEQVGDLYGYSVATDGDSLAVGSPYRTHAGGVRAGTVHWVDPDDPATGTTVIAEDADDEDYFGTSVAVSGSKLVVGAPGDDNAAGLDAGSVYVYGCSTGSCSAVTKLVADDLGPGDGLGWSVGTHFNRLVAGAPKSDLGEAEDAGAAYFYYHEYGTMVWTEQAKLVADDAAAGDHFGGAVAMNFAHDTYRVVVGAPFTDHAGAGSGTAYAFSSLDGGDTWTLDATLTHPEAAGADFFGFSVNVSEDTVLAGSPTDDHEGLTDAGSAHLFEIPLFACDFESGDTSSWSTVVP